jgi:hypothetical protein
MIEKFNAEQLEGKREESKEQSFGIRPEVELSQVGTKAEVQQSIIKKDPNNLKETSKEYTRGDKPNENISTDIETSGDKWGRIIEDKQRAGIEIELPL